MAELQERMGSAEFTEWLAYERISPWGADRDDLRFAMLAAAVVNTIRGAIGRGAKMAKLDDFMLKFEEQKPVDWDAENARMWETIKRAVGVKHGH